MENKEVVMRIKMLIESKNVSPSGFAKLIGYNQSNLSKVLRGERVFTFCEQYSSMADFNRAINIGLKQVGKDVGDRPCIESN